MLFGWNRVGPGLHFFATCMVALGTLISTFWILASNSWMQTPQGYDIQNGIIVPADWFKIVFNPSFPFRLLHMSTAAFIASAFFVGASAAWHLLRKNDTPAIRKMLSMAMWMALIVAPIQAMLGDAHGLNTLEHQPAKIAAIEGHWENPPNEPTPLILFGIPDMEQERTKYAVEIPYLGSLIKEYNQYCQWAASQLSNLRWNTRVDYVNYDDSQQCYRIRSVNSQTGEPQEWLARHLVLGTGPAAWMPECSRPHRQRLIHSSEYLVNKAELHKKKSITVLGSGQSAAEIYYDLLTDIDSHGYQLNWVTRAPRFYPLEYTKLTLEMTSPEWIDYFHDLPPAKRDALNARHKNLYKGINSSLINAIYDLMYVKQLDGELNVNLFTHSELKDMRWLPEGEFELTLHQQEQERDFTRRTQGLVMATGYQYRPPMFIEGIAQRLRWDEKGRYDVQRNYSIDHHNQVFVQNAELHTHGFVTPDLGMACYRNSVLLRELAGREVYPVERQIAFQTFPAQSER